MKQQKKQPPKANVQPLKGSVRCDHEVAKVEKAIYRHTNFREV